MKLLTKYSLLAGAYFTLFEATFWKLAWTNIETIPAITRYILKIGEYADPNNTQSFNLESISTGIFFLILSALFFALFVQNVFNGIEEIQRKK